MSGRLIIFEGIDGSGKSTQIDLLRTKLESTGVKVQIVREPGGTELSEKIRDMLLDPGSAALNDRAEALLFSAARAQLVHQIIMPALDDDAFVICDRYSDSTVAYQGYGRELPLEQIISTQRLATGDLRPDLKILLDVEVDMSFNRLKDRDEDRMESSGQAFRQRVRHGYLESVKNDPDVWLVLDGSLEPQVIAEKIYSTIKEKFLNG